MIKPAEILAKLLGSSVRSDSEVFQAPADVLMTTLGHHHFYSNAYRTLLRIAIGLGFTVIALILVSCWVVLTAHPQDRFFVAAVDGRVERILPLDTPVATNDEMVTRVAMALGKALTFGFLDYDQRRVENRPFFTNQAFDQLHRLVLGAGGTSRMTEDQRIYKTEVDRTKPPLVLRQEVNKDFTYEWVFQIPVIVSSFRGASEEPEAVHPLTLNVLVQSAREVEVTRGYVVTQVEAVAGSAVPGGAR